MDNTMSGAESLATAPPPPSEVKVRTLRSDLESMAKSGGGLPRFQNVKVEGLSAGKETVSEVAQTESKGNLLKIILLVAGVAVVIIGGWFAYTQFSASTPSTDLSTIPEAPAHVTQSHSGAAPLPTPIPKATTTAPAPAPTPTPIATPAPTPTGPFLHLSYFKKAPDQTLKMKLSVPGAVQSAEDLQSYNQKLVTLLNSANKSAAFLEVAVQAADGHDPTVTELFSQQNAQVIDPQVLAMNFGLDATFFVYRDKSGNWPGYVLGLNQPQNWASAQAGIKNIESASGVSTFSNIFLADAGSPGANGFIDLTIASSSARMLAFTGGTPTSAFVYGWTPDHKYLILSTSQAGFAAAVKHL